MSQDDPHDKLQREWLRLFHDLVYHRHPATHFGNPAWQPTADLVVSDQSARVIFELAGVPHQNVRVRLLGNRLEVSGRREPPHDVQGAHYHRAEIYFGEFRRLVELPWVADQDQVHAKFREGMLEVELVAAPQARRAEIPIQQHTP